MAALPSIPRRALRGAVVFAVVLSSSWLPRVTRAEVAEGSPRPNEQFDFMNLLTDHGLHDLTNERFNAYGQVTTIASYKLPFAAAYTNKNGSINSLLPTGEGSWTTSFTLYFGAKLWHDAGVYFVPEVIAERPLSQLRGLGGAIQNFELQKTGAETPQVYRSRLYLQQTIDLGGARGVDASDPMVLGRPSRSRSVVVRVGNFAVNDFLDKNTFAGDLRRQFFNMAFLTYAAYDFAADARGYSWGLEAELDYDAWAIRFARMAVPQDPNQLPLDLKLDQHYGDQVELERQYSIFGKAGAIRVLGYRNRENMGRFDEALAAFRADPSKNATTCTSFNYGSQNASAPDLCWARRDNVKVGIGVSLEQHVTEDIGLFFRGMFSDGKTEVYSFTSTDRSVSFGMLGKGPLWHRPRDVAGVGVGLGWISDEHAAYLRAGGVDGFIGDGYITPAVESVFELFYSLNLRGPVWLSGDYQHIAHPAFNADRGPVDIFAARVHAEF